MWNNETILAGEDSGGLSVGEHIPEKDGLFANLLIIEMLAKENKTLNQLVNEINEFIGSKFYTNRVDVKLNDDKKVLEIQEKFKHFDKIASFDIKEKLELDGIKLFLNDGLTSLLIRKSGTEPLLRFYIESDKLSYIDEIKKFINENI